MTINRSKIKTTKVISTYTLLTNRSLLTKNTDKDIVATKQETMVSNKDVDDSLITACTIEEAGVRLVWHVSSCIQNRYSNVVVVQ